MVRAGPGPYPIGFGPDPTSLGATTPTVHRLEGRASRGRLRGLCFSPLRIPSSWTFVKTRSPHSSRSPGLQPPSPIGE